MKVFNNNKVYAEFQFEKEADFEREVVVNSKLFFGTNSVYIDAKKKIETKTLGNSIPDGFLFDLSDSGNPEFYLVEVELAKHDFYNHIFPQITKFFGFFRNPKSLNDLVEKIHSIITNDINLKKELKIFLGEKEIYKFIKDTIEKSQNILLVIDGEKKELPEIIETYTDTWGKMVKLVLLKKFSQNGEFIYTMNPDFENIEFAEVENEAELDRTNTEYTEEYHFEGVSDNIKQAFTSIKAALLQSQPNLIFNPQKFYISIRKEKNIAFFLVKRKKISLVVLKSEEETKNRIHEHSIKVLKPGVQKFWGGPSCAVIIENSDHIEEVISFLKQMI